VDHREKEHFFSLLEGEFHSRNKAQAGGQGEAGSPADHYEEFPLLDFARKIFALTPVEELTAEPVADIAGLLASLRDFMLKPSGSEAKIRCFNPSQEEDGWVHRHTQIFVLQRDMPFLVDSIRMILNRKKIGIHAVNSTVFNVVRDRDGTLVSISDRVTDDREALILVQIDRSSSEDERASLVREIARSLVAVEVVTDDHRPMLAALSGVIAAARENFPALSDESLNEYIAFLEWVKDNHFTFLAYSYYQVSAGSDPQISPVKDRQLGLFRISEREIEPQRISSLAAGYRLFHEGNEFLTLARSSLRSTVHRDAYCDYIVIKDYNSDGLVIGEHRFSGLYTNALAYSQSPFTIPYIRQKLVRVFALSGLSPSSHDGKAFRAVMETHPREELFHATEQQLYDTLIAIWQIQERRQVRLFIRPDTFEKFISCILYFPKDTYRTEIREKTQAILMDRLDASESQFTTYFTESLLVRTYFVLRINSDRYSTVDQRQLEQEINTFTHDWRDDLKAAIFQHWGEEQGQVLVRSYYEAFPVSYREHFSPREAVQDIGLLHELENEQQIAMCTYQSPGAEHNVIRFKIFHPNTELLLSDIVPILENLGFIVRGEHPYTISRADRPPVWLHEFSLQFTLDIAIDVPGVRQNFQEAFAAIWQRRIDDDSFNRLVVGARLDWRSVAIIRLYAHYMKQLGLPISQGFIAQTFSANLDITRNLVALFKTRFDPKVVQHEADKGERSKRLESKIVESLDKIANLNEDQVLRNYLQLICATVRTNFFQKDSAGQPKDYVSVKLQPRSVLLVPEPRPEYEVFVYSPRVEGVHLRAGKIARGGIRWSDRVEDYRTEILGLVKAQQVKNAVIVPTGAKGGFIAKKIPVAANRDQVQAEGIECYKIFMQGLLDVTDNIVGGDIVPPDDVVRHDADDAYLVVAADKGTASFSDIANTISERNRHWLGDAFASGGSHGYDHKKMAITARGAWVAVQRHFRELGLNTQEDDFTVVGIGDMSGDVFGNGMLLSPHIKLVAAFNHQSIFIDPEPDAAASFNERSRLFNLPRSSWDDYNRALISKGGGIYSRAAKAIPLSEQARALFGIEQQSLTPAQLVNYLLKAPVDLLWNGGVGTYVKSRLQSHADVGDKANDEVRINGSELRCRVVGEGGNLGMTQLGRIEYALNGGACNTDFIDNMGGVACSDIEVNIKIVLNQLVADEDLTIKQRNAFLADMTDEVTELVLHRSYRQTQGISLAKLRCDANLSEFWHCLSDWSEAGMLNRDLEQLPHDDALLEREKTGKGLARPELSILVSHSKIMFKAQLLNSDALDDPWIAKALMQAFPPAMTQRFADKVASHPLSKEIIANYLTNEIVDVMGLSFTHRLMKSTGADAGQLVRAYIIMRDALKLDTVWAEIEALDYQLDASQQLKLFAGLMRLGRRTTRWIIRNRRSCQNTGAEIARLEPLLSEMLNAGIANYQAAAPEEESDISRWLSMGLNHYAAILIDSANDLFFAFGMADVSVRTGVSLDLVSEAYRQLEAKLNIDWFSTQIIQLPTASRWDDYARESFMDELESLYRAMAVAMLENIGSEESIAERIDQWQAQHKAPFERWQDMVRELNLSPQRNYAMFSVALRELKDLVETIGQPVKLAEVCSLG